MIHNCALCKREKARTQVNPLQMTDIPNRHFDKIAIDLVSDLNISTSGNQHILIIIDHLMGWPEAFPIPNKKAETIVHIFINNYMPIYMCPHFILSDNGTEFKNQLMDNVLHQIGINHIFSAPYHPQSNGQLEVYHKYLKPTLKKLCENDPDNKDKYINQVLDSYHVIPHLATTATAFFLVYGRDPNLPLHQILEPIQQFLSDPDSACLDLKSHCLALAIAKTTLDENRFKHAQKTTNGTPPNFKVGDKSILQKQATWQMGPEVESWLQDCPYTVQ